MQYLKGTMMRVTTVYADGFGRWHAEIEQPGNGIADVTTAERLAYDAIESEIKARHHDDVLTGVALTRRTSRDGIMTYYFEEEA